MSSGAQLSKSVPGRYLTPTYTNENIQKPKVNMPNIAKEYKVNYGKLRIWAYHDHITTIYPPARRRETIRIASLRDGRRDPSWIQLGHFVVKTRTTHIDFWSKFRSFWWIFDPLNLGLGYLGISWNILESHVWFDAVEKSLFLVVCILTAISCCRDWSGND